MRYVAIAIVGIVVLAGTFSSSLIVLAVIAAALAYALPRMRELATVIGCAWIASGVLLLFEGIHLAVVSGGILFTIAFVSLPAASRRRRHIVLMLVGELLIVVGVVTAWIGIGLLIAPVGLAVYLVTAVRTRLFAWWAAAAALVLVGVGARLGEGPIAAVAPIVVGLDVVLASGYASRRAAGTAGT